MRNANDPRTWDRFEGDDEVYRECDGCEGEFREGELHKVTIQHYLCDDCMAEEFPEGA